MLEDEQKLIPKQTPRGNNLINDIKNTPPLTTKVTKAF